MDKRRKLDKTLMSDEEYKILVTDLCSRLPHGVKVRVSGDWFYDELEQYDTELKIGKPSNLLDVFVNQRGNSRNLTITPYLRPMDSMTEEERDEIIRFTRDPQRDEWTFSHIAYDYLDWLIVRNFDFRGLIGMGLALPATNEMYKQ